MQHSPVNRFRFTLLSLFVAAACWSQSPAQQPAGPRDDLVGWYALPPRAGASNSIPQRGEILIPILKQKDAYFTVCRGVEVPLKPCVNGLEWAMLPSSMEGTKITRDPASGALFITIMDRMEQSMNDNSKFGEPRLIGKTSEPVGLISTKAPAPKRLEDFAGNYRFLWQPWARYEIASKNGGFQMAAYHWVNNGWTSVSSPNTFVDLRPLQDQLGFVSKEGRSPLKIIFNSDRGRFELETGKTNQPPLTIPLAKCAEADLTRFPASQIGIPSWH